MRAKVRYSVDGWIRVISGLVLREDEQFLVLQSDRKGDNFTIAKRAILERIDSSGGST